MYKSGACNIIGEPGKQFPNVCLTKCISLTNIVLPDSITVIGQHAFENCTKLESVKIPDKVTTMEWGIFWECSGLTECNTSGRIGRVLETVSFRNCVNLTEVVLPENLESMGTNVFYWM